VGRHSRYTYAELETHVNSATAAFATLGLKAGDHIACSIGNDPELIVAFLAVMRLGAVWIGIPPRLAGPEKAYILQDSEAAAFLADAATFASLGPSDDLPALKYRIELEPGRDDCEWRNMLARHQEVGRPRTRVKPWAPAAIAYTSGTTGFPKGVVHSQHNIVQLAACRAQSDPRDFFAPRQRVGIVQPLAILNIIVMSVINTLLTGGVCVCSDRSDAVGIAEWVEREKIQAMGTAATTVFDLLTREDIPPTMLQSLDNVVIGGGPCSEQLRAMFVDRFGRPPIIGYGLTEGPGQVASSHPDEPTPPGASGYAHPHIRLAILDPNGNLLPTGVEGEICVTARDDGPFARVYSPMLGYWKKPEATARSLVGGWLRTGDFGSLDDDGYVTLTARMNDVIIRGGANIYPAEIERVLGAAAQVKAVAVIGRPDPRLGETVEAFVQLMPDERADRATEEALAALCRANLAKYKVPAHWTFVRDMPRNSMDKIVKSRLREMTPEEIT
jgi:acyl-CoA synthetase (AMP-forming)/AMP-acid ligase II